MPHTPSNRFFSKAGTSLPIGELPPGADGSEPESPAEGPIENVADDNEFVRIGYGGEAELPRAEKLIRKLKERTDLTDEQIQLAHVSPIVGAHTGSTVLSFFFKQKNER